MAPHLYLIDPIHYTGDTFNLVMKVPNKSVSNLVLQVHISLPCPSPTKKKIIKAMAGGKKPNYHVELNLLMLIMTVSIILNGTLIKNLILARFYEVPAKLLFKKRCFEFRTLVPRSFTLKASF